MFYVKRGKKALAKTNKLWKAAKLAVIYDNVSIVDSKHNVLVEYVNGKGIVKDRINFIRCQATEIQEG